MFHCSRCGLSRLSIIGQRRGAGNDRVRQSGDPTARSASYLIVSFAADEPHLSVFRIDGDEAWR